MRSLIVPLLGIALLGGCDKQSIPAPQAADAPTKAAAPEVDGTVDLSHKGKAMPKVAFEAPGGGTVTLDDFRGRPLLVNLWATWCGPCVAEMPTLDALAVREAARLQVLVVSQDGQGRKLVDDYWNKQSFKMLKPYLDQKSDLGFGFATGIVPTTVLFDKDGKEVWRVTGGMNWNGPRADTLLAETLLAKTPG